MVSMAATVAVLEPTRRYSVSDVIYGAEDPDDWKPEEESIASDPLTIEEIDDKWIQFYTDRIHTQIEQFLTQDG